MNFLILFQLFAFLFTPSVFSARTESAKGFNYCDTFFYSFTLFPQKIVHMLQKQQYFGVQKGQNLFLTSFLVVFLCIFFFYFGVFLYFSFHYNFNNKLNKLFIYQFSFPFSCINRKTIKKNLKNKRKTLFLHYDHGKMFYKIVSFIHSVLGWLAQFDFNKNILP